MMGRSISLVAVALGMSALLVAMAAPVFAVNSPGTGPPRNSGSPAGPDFHASDQGHLHGTGPGADVTHCRNIVGSTDTHSVVVEGTGQGNAGGGTCVV